MLNQRNYYSQLPIRKGGLGRRCDRLRCHRAGSVLKASCVWLGNLLLHSLGLLKQTITEHRLCVRLWLCAWAGDIDLPLCSEVSGEVDRTGSQPGCKELEGRDNWVSSRVGSASETRTQIQAEVVPSWETGLIPGMPGWQSTWGRISETDGECPGLASSGADSRSSWGCPLTVGRMRAALNPQFFHDFAFLPVLSCFPESSLPGHPSGLILCSWLWLKK